MCIPIIQELEAFSDCFLIGGWLIIFWTVSHSSGHQLVHLLSYCEILIEKDSNIRMIHLWDFLLLILSFFPPILRTNYFFKLIRSQSEDCLKL